MNKPSRDATKAILEHFGVKIGELLLPTPENYSDEYTLFDKPIEVVYGGTALYNEFDNLSGDVNKLSEVITLDQIGIYKRLGESTFYFRWL